MRIPEEALGLKEPIDIRGYFQGKWRVERTLDGAPFFEGAAAFQSINENGCLHYREDGEALYPNGFSASSFREYYFVVGEDGFEVYFDRELSRLFNAVTLSTTSHGASGAAVHECNPDMYYSTYVIRGWDCWSWEHRVSGHRKDFTLHAVYKRIDNNDE